MSTRKLGVVLAAICAALLIVPVAASAQSTATPVPVTSFSNIPVSGKAPNGKTFTGHFNVTQFVSRGGKPFALGTLTGRLGNRTVKRSNVLIPVSANSTNPPLLGAKRTSGQVASPAATCAILHLTLGPLNLNLLGLTVHLNQVILNVDAQSGAGQLLGNLLCSVAHLLDQTGLTSGQLSSLLNIVQQLLNLPGLTTL